MSGKTQGLRCIRRWSLCQNRVYDSLWFPLVEAHLRVSSFPTKSFRSDTTLTGRRIRYLRPSRIPPPPQSSLFFVLCFECRPCNLLNVTSGDLETSLRHGSRRLWLCRKLLVESRIMARYHLYLVLVKRVPHEPLVRNPWRVPLNPGQTGRFGIQTVDVRVVWYIHQVGSDPEWTGSPVLIRYIRSSRLREQ